MACGPRRRGRCQPRSHTVTYCGASRSSPDTGHARRSVCPCSRTPSPPTPRHTPYHVVRCARASAVRFYLQGNAIAGKANIGYALAASMVIIMLATNALYLLVQRRSSGGCSDRRGARTYAVPVAADEEPKRRSPVVRPAPVNWLVRTASWLFLATVRPLPAPVLSMLTHTGLQKGVPTVKLGRSTILKGWTLEPMVGAFQSPGFTSTLWLSSRLVIGAIVVTLALLLPTAIWVHLRIPKARHRRDADRAAVRRSADHARRRCSRRVPTRRAVALSERLPARAVLRHPHHAVHVSFARRRHSGHRPAHAR